ncbi:MAG TPA: twin-arginine translocation signal domain-containing protein, partial [Methylomirabilota bacterium]|nr:twin-arginine translocation signal domain-containing protein [Methylomirabilota bacterium]
MNLSRRNVLKLTATLAGAGAIGPAAALLEPDAAQAQTPKRGGVFRIRGEDPVSGLDPHLVVNHHRIATNLSFTHSR